MLISSQSTLFYSILYVIFINVNVFKFIETLHLFLTIS